MPAFLDDEDLALVEVAGHEGGVVEVEDRLVHDGLASVEHGRDGVLDALRGIWPALGVAVKDDGLRGVDAALLGCVEDALSDEHLALEGLPAGLGHDHALDDVALGVGQRVAHGGLGRLHGLSGRGGGVRDVCADSGGRRQDVGLLLAAGRGGEDCHRDAAQQKDGSGQRGSSQGFPLGTTAPACYTCGAGSVCWQAAGSSRMGRPVATGGPFFCGFHWFLLSLSPCDGQITEGVSEVAELGLSDGVSGQQHEVVVVVVVDLGVPLPVYFIFVAGVGLGTVPDVVRDPAVEVILDALAQLLARDRDLRAHAVTSAPRGPGASAPGGSGPC